jgi:23S rRNA G2445 N2-methylase RlmL
MPTWAATVAPGLEPTTRRELDRHGAAAVEVPFGGNGLVAFEVADHEAGRALLHELRTVHRLGPLLDAGRADPEDPFADLTHAVERVDWTPWIGEDTGWALRAARHGDHPFTSVDLERRVGGALDDLLQRRRAARPPVELDDPDATARLHVGDDGGYALWLDLVGQASLHRRAWKTYEHPAAMKPTMAAALAVELDWTPGARLADPTAGGATLPIEAALLELGASPARGRVDDLLVRRVPRWRDLDPPAAATLDPDPPPDVDPWLVVGDRAPAHVEGARRNLEAAGLLETARVVEDGAAALAEHVDAAGAVVANPPYGLRSGDGDLAGTHRALVEQADRALGSGGRLGVITARGALVREAAEGAALAPRVDRAVHHGRLRVRLMVLARDRA